MYNIYFLYFCKENVGKWKAFLALLIFANTSLYKQRHGFQKSTVHYNLPYKFYYLCVHFMMPTVPARSVPDCFFFWISSPVQYIYSSLLWQGAEPVFVNLLKSPGIDSQTSGIDSSLLWQCAESVYVNLFKSPGIDSQPGGPVRQPYLTYRPAGYIGWRNWFLGIDSWLLKRFQIRALTGDAHLFYRIVGYIL
jgi:hypothetical protein